MKILRVATASMVAVVAFSLIGCAKDKNTPVTANEQEEAQFQGYVDCLRQQGIDASYTQDGQGKGTFDVKVPPDDPKFVAARRACADKVPQEMKKSVSAAELDALTKVAACMRKQGIDVKDPTADDSSLKISGGEDESKKATEVRAACEKNIQGASPSPSS